MPANEFGPIPFDDERWFEEASAALIARFPPAERAAEEFLDDVRLLLDWKWQYADGDLARWTRADVEVLLLEWVPRKMIMAPDLADELLVHVRRFVDVLAGAGVLRGDHPTVLKACVERCRTQMLDGLADPALSPGKAVMSAMAEAGIDLRDAAAMDRWVDEFNARPFAERDALLGRAIDPEPEPIVLRARPAPDGDSVRVDAEGAPVLATFERLRAFLGEGRPLTAKGNLKLADARALVDVLETGDSFDTEIRGHTFHTRSAAELPVLSFLVALAKECRAVRVERGRMLPVKAWARLSAISQLERVVKIVFDVGPLLLRRSWVPPALEAPETVCDVAVNSLLAQMYSEHRSLEFDAAIDGVAVAVAKVLDRDMLPEGFEYTIAEHGLEDAFDLLERCAIVRWSGSHVENDRYGFSHRVGGQLSLTPFGVHACQRVLPDLGFTCPSIPAFTAAASDGASEIVVQLRAQLDAGGPALLCDAFDALEAPEIVGDLWRVDDPATAPVLDALGRHHLDRNVAKAARKAAMQHRSWRANQPGG